MRLAKFVTTISLIAAFCGFTACGADGSHAKGGAGGNGGATSAGREYSIQSTASGKSVATWEDTRVFPGGLTFYPTGDLAPTGGTFPLPTTQTSFDCTWFQYPATVSASARLIADGKEGWIAHITSGGYVLVKK